MTRFLWLVAATLILVAVGAPCLTFYMLIKEYWLEIDSLRQELLICQLSSKDPLRKNGLPGPSPFLSKVSDPTVEEAYPSLPLPQRLTSSQPENEPNFISTVTERSADDLEVISLSSSQNIRSKDASSVVKESVGIVSSPHVHTPSPNSVMVADGLISQENANEKIICVSEDYVKTLEKRVEDLSARLDASRKCLTPALQKDARCGGGTSWRDFRRKERITKKRIRTEKKKRRKQERKEKKKYTNEEFDNSMNAPIEATGKPLSDISQIYEFRTNSFQNQGNHQMRENHRASTDFRRGFNQKIVRMDEALMQFTETQSAFCKELRDNLGGRLEKRGQELEALSEQIAALVRTTTSQVAMIEKLTSDQVQTGKTSIEKNLANLQVLREEQVRSFQNFHKKVFLPAMLTLTSLLGEQASAVTNMGVDLITKIEMLQDFFLTFSTKQGDTLKKLSEEVSMFASKHGNLIMRSRDHAKHLHLNTENFIRELQTRMNNVVKELVLVRLQSQSFISINENTYHEISASLNTTEDVVSKLSVDLQRRVDRAKSEDVDFSNGFRQETDLINSRIETGVSEALIRNHAAMSQIGETELDTRAFSNRGEAAWNEMYENQETELRQEADMLANKLRSQTHHTQNILEGLRGTASTHEQVLEQQRMDFQGFVRKRQDALDTQCSSISDWSLLMSSELRHRDEDLHRFLSEDLRLSPAIVTGVTELTSRLPDGSVLYDPSPSTDNLSSREDSGTIATSPTTEMAPEYRTIHLGANSSEERSSVPPINTFQLPNNSSRSNSSNPVNETDAMKSLRESSKEESDGPQRGDLTGVNLEELTGVTSQDLTGANSRELTHNSHDSPDKDETLSNDIKVYNDTEFDNKITHQSDQAIAKSPKCKNRPPGHSNSFKEDGGDAELERIILEAQKTVLKFQKEIQGNGKLIREKKMEIEKNKHKTIT